MRALCHSARARFWAGCTSAPLRSAGRRAACWRIPPLAQVDQSTIRLPLPSQRSPKSYLGLQGRATFPQTPPRHRTAPWTERHGQARNFSAGNAQQQQPRMRPLIGGGSGQGFRAAWSSNPGFRRTIIYTAGGAVVFFWWNLEEVPVSGRKRFNATPSSWEEGMSHQMYEQTVQQYQGRILPAHHPTARMVERVLERLIPESGLTDNEQKRTKWEVYVIDDPEQKNAFVIPGGKVFVFSGILPICRGEDGLAAVLGHEIAHNVAHHAAERMSQAFIVLGFVQVLLFLYGAPDVLSRILLDTVFMKPGSRKQESEADYIGLLMMAKSCFNPDAALGLWQRMSQLEQQAPPQWLSTHPSSENRVERIRAWLPEAHEKRDSSECASTTGYANDFRRAFSQSAW